MFANPFNKAFIVRNATGEQNAVHLTFENSCSSTDFFRNLVCHGFVNQRCFHIAGFDHIFHLLRIVGAEIGHQTAFAGDHFLYLV
ncbi:hypothetical protein SDC9_125103 [bioreactor metagenome]|uniref:Uncharacterized protein n=1 Tax=bioreactor metagenome TaxID=1076179 RepID=A0A645CMC0_9ZZZZ